MVRGKHTTKPFQVQGLEGKQYKVSGVVNINSTFRVNDAMTRF